MVNYFTCGLRRIFGIKPKKRRLAPYGSIMRPKLVYDSSGQSYDEEVNNKKVKELSKKIKKKK